MTIQEYSGKVLRVVDGDTLDCIIDLGFDISIRKRCRLHGIDTPELRSKDPSMRGVAIECKMKVEEILAEGKNRVKIIYHGDGKFGRPLVELIVNEKNINKVLIETGYAKEYFGGKR